jgi:hypothetical protein
MPWGSWNHIGLNASSEQHFQKLLQKLKSVPFSLFFDFLLSNATEEFVINGLTQVFVHRDEN